MASAQRRCRTCGEWKPIGCFSGVYSKQCEACRHAPCAVCGRPTDQGRKTCSDECKMVLVRRGSEKGRRRQIARAARRKTQLCPACAKRKPRNPDHFYVSRRNPDGTVKALESICRSCKRADQKQRYRSDPQRREGALRRAKAQRQRIKVRVREEAEFAAEWRRKRRDWSRAYEQRRKAGPNGDGASDEKDRLPRLPAKPLAEAIRRVAARRQAVTGDSIAEGEGLRMICEALGITDRDVRAWSVGERQSVNLGTADRFLVMSDLHLWDVWSPEEFPAVAEMLGYAD